MWFTRGSMVVHMERLGLHFQFKVIFKSFRYVCWLVVISMLLQSNESFAKNDNGKKTPGFNLPDQASERASGNNNGERSDLNQDHIVNFLDLEIFSNDYLEKDWEEVNWCNFYEATATNKRFFRDRTSYNKERFTRLIKFIEDSYDCPHISQAVDKSDQNGDAIVDNLDLTLFGTVYLETYWGTVDWCLFYESTIAGADFEGRRTKYYLKHFGQLLVFINDNFYCGGSELPANTLSLENTPKFLARIADAAYFSGDYYITDPTVGSLFIFDANLVLKGEIKGLNKPLGVAVDSQGYILVGNDGRDNIEVYDPSSGELLAEFGMDLVKMPTAITLDFLGNIYVTDSRSNSVLVFDSAYNLLRVIGKSGAQGALHFPIDTEIVTSIGGGANSQEVFVADRGNERIQVYDLEGNWLRNFTFGGTDGQNCRFDWASWGYICAIPGAPPFTKVQALDIDSFGRLHVLDSFAASVTMFDPTDGTFLGSYGGYGAEPGSLRVPMDLLVSDANEAIVTSGDGDRIEVYTVPL